MCGSGEFSARDLQQDALFGALAVMKEFGPVAGT